MKKFYSILGMSLISAVAFSQATDVGQTRSLNSKVSTAKPTKAHNEDLSSRAVYLTETFSGTFPPTGWTVSSGPLSTTTNGDQDWHLEQTGNPSGCASVLYVNSVDTHDEYLTSPEFTLPASGDFRVAFDFNTSAYWHVAAGVLEGGNTDNVDITMEVSIDAGATWAVIWQEDIEALNIAAGSWPWETYEWTTSYVSLSAYAGEDVTLRWRYYGLDGAQFNMDNIIVSDALANDLSITQLYSGDIINSYEYYATPLSQIQPVVLGVVARNLGLNAQTARNLDYNVKLNGTSVNSGSGDFTLAPFERDTVWFTTNFTPTVVGTYTWTATLDADDNAVNDADSLTFEVTDYIYGHDFPATYAEGIENFDEQDAEYGIGAVFQIVADAPANGAHIKFATGTTAGMAATIQLLELGASIQDIAATIDETVHEVTAADINNANGTTIPLAGSTLEAGKIYMLIVKKDAGSDRLYIAASNEGDDDLSTVGYGPFGTGGAVNYYNNWGWSPAVRLDLEEPVAPNSIKESNGLATLNNFPNPATASTVISYSIKESAQVSFEVIDINGKMVYTSDKGTQAAGEYQFNLDVTDYAAGIYYYSMVVNGKKITKKLAVK